MFDNVFDLFKGTVQRDVDCGMKKKVPSARQIFTLTSKLLHNCQLKTKRRSNTLKGSQRMVSGWIFLKTFRASLFNDDLSNEPNFGRIHLVGQYV
jgi:hypothetical protein